MKKVKSFIILFICLIFPLSVFSQIYKWEDPDGGFKFTIDVSHTFYAKGILLMVLGDYDSQNLIGDNSFYDKIREVCRVNDLAYLGVRLPNCNVRESFDEAIDYFAQVSHHPELRSAPLIIEGLSYGTRFATCLAYTQFQDKIVAYIISSGWNPQSEVENGNNKYIPGLWIPGGLNEDGWLDRIKELFYQYRGEGALWTSAVIPEMGHERGPNEMINSYINSLMNMRIDPETKEMLLLSDDQYWYGNNEILEWYPADGFPFDIDSASWLPSAEFAAIWKKYTRGEHLLTTPAAQKNTDIRVSYSPSEASLEIQNIRYDKNLRIELIDVQGRIISSRSYLDVENNKITFSTRRISKGIYYVRIIGNDLLQTIPVGIF